MVVVNDVLMVITSHLFILYIERDLHCTKSSIYIYIYIYIY